MKCCQLNKQNNKNLIVFFAGWSFDEKPFGNLVCDGFDILFIYDYNELNLLGLWGFLLLMNLESCLKILIIK